MTQREELERELNSLKNNGLIRYFEIGGYLTDNDTSFDVHVLMHEKRGESDAR